MDCRIAFSGDAFERLIRYRVMDAFRPVTTPLDYPRNAKSWLDGIVVTQVALDRVPQERVVIMNEIGADGKVGSTAGAQAFHASAVRVELAVTVHLARIEAVAAAGLAQPPTEPVHIPRGPLRVTVRFDVGSDGIPLLVMELDAARLASAGLPPEAVGAVVSAANSTTPFDVAKVLEPMLPTGAAKVLNAAVTRTEDGAVVMRFEFPDAKPRPLIDRFLDWRSFCDGHPPAELGADDWSVSLDGRAVAAMLAAKVAPLVKDDHPIHFDPGVDSGFVDGGPPRVVVKKLGRIENACAGNDVRFEAFVNVSFSVPAENLLRGALSFDVDKDDWDVAKCFGLALVNPLFLFITLFDQKKAGLGLGLLALSVVFPVQPVALVLAIGALLAGVDRALANQLIDDQLKGKPDITNVGDGYAYDQPMQLSNAMTRDWLVLKETVGSSGRLVLRGLLRVPDPVLPRVRARDLEGLTPWRLRDRCEPGRGQKTVGSLQLDLDPGYWHDQGQTAPRRPTISLKYGLRSDGGAWMYEVVADRLGVFQDPASEYTQIEYLGVPGTLAVQLQSATVRKEAFAGFAEAPYGLRLRFFTNGGVREYQFGAPPVLTQYTETPAQTALRISRCKQLGSDLVLKRYLELQWLVDPPFDGRFARQWEIHVLGLEPGRTATVWNAGTGESLVRAYADPSGRVDVSLIVPSEEQGDSLIMSLDDLPFPNGSALLQERVGDPAAESQARVAWRQTILREIAYLEVGRPVAAVGFAGSGEAAQLVISTQDGGSVVHSLDVPPRPCLGVAARAGWKLPDEGEARQGQLAWHGGRRRFTVLSHAVGRPEVVAEYTGRSASDLTAARDGLLAQVSADNERVTVFRRDATRQTNPLEWATGADTPADDS